MAFNVKGEILFCLDVNEPEVAAVEQPLIAKFKFRNHQQSHERQRHKRSMKAGAHAYDLCVQPFISIRNILSVHIRHQAGKRQLQLFNAEEVHRGWQEDMGDTRAVPALGERRWQEAGRPCYP